MRNSPSGRRGKPSSKQNGKPLATPAMPPAKLGSEKADKASTILGRSKTGYTGVLIEEIWVAPDRKVFPRALDRLRRPSVTRRQAWPHRAEDGSNAPQAVDQRSRLVC